MRKTYWRKYLGTITLETTEDDAIYLETTCAKILVPKEVLVDFIQSSASKVKK